jgi:hypothetical protein
VTLPALNSLATTTAVVVAAGASGLSAAPAPGATLPLPRATHPPASHFLPAAIAVALRAEPRATATHGPGAEPAGLVASSVAGAPSGAWRPVAVGESRRAGRSGAGRPRIRAPPR